MYTGASAPGRRWDTNGMAAAQGGPTCIRENCICHWCVAARNTFQPVPVPSTSALDDSVADVVPSRATVSKEAWEPPGTVQALSTSSTAKARADISERPR